MSEVETTPAETTPASHSRNRTKFIIGSAAIVLVVVYLIFSSIGGATAFYLTIAELHSEGPDALGQKVRVIGVVEGDSIRWDDRQLNLQFAMSDESGRLLVHYRGSRPDMLQEGAEAVVEGRLTQEGVFEASSLMLKCPSKYEEAATAQANSD